MTCPILRRNEQLLRRCTSVEKAKLLVPDLISVSSGGVSASLKLCGNTESGKSIYHLVQLEDFCFYIPGYLDNNEKLTNEILTNLIDNPPHANNISPKAMPVGNTSKIGLWEEFLAAPNTARLQRLRWSCVGYHYNWTDRRYDPECKSAFPDSFCDIYNRVLTSVNNACSSNLSGKAESAIINFYHSQRISDRLGGHRDDVELTDDSPLVSISMGLSAVFLVESQAIVLGPGDVIVMAGKARQSLHAVPCVFSTKKRPHAYSGACTEFLSNTRISISIRQVY